MIVGIDPGKSGGITFDDSSISMPTKKILIKKAFKVFMKDSNDKKILIKSGSNKGQYKTKIKTPAKYATELDVHAINKIFQNKKILVIEAQGTTAGNSAKSSATTAYNIGKIHALAEVNNMEIIIVTAAKWKKDLNCPADKEPCVLLAEKLSGKSFRTDRGAMLDGPAESWLIRHNYLNKKDK